MRKLSDQRINKRVIRVHLNWPTLETLLSCEAMKFIGIGSNESESKAVVEIKQLKEGSPSYNIDKWEATITITTDYSSDT